MALEIRVSLKLIPWKPRFDLTQLRSTSYALRDFEIFIMSGMSSGSLLPTWVGHVNTTRDALILFEACLQGQLNHVPRRPHDRERSQLIRSGFVFIFEENASGIKRWTDGVPWSPSRILGNFLVYRELMKPFPPGEKKRATKRSKAMSKYTKSGEPYPRQQSTDSLPPSPTMGKLEGGADNNEERALIGSLIDSYGFKEDGLVKKTISVNLHGIQHHLVSYYRVEDVKKGTLQSPSTDPKLFGIEPRVELIANQSFKSPLDALEDTLQDQMNALQQSGYGFGLSDYRPPVAMTSAPYTSHPELGLYTPSTYSSAPLAQQTSYAYSPSSYYPATGSGSQSPTPRQEGYNPYSLQYTTSNLASTTLHGRTSSLTQPNTYPYRPPQTLGLTPRSTPMSRPSSLIADRKTPDNASWASGSGIGSYTSSPTSTSSIRSSYPNYSTSGSPTWGAGRSMTPRTPTSGYTRTLGTKHNSYQSPR